MFNLKGLDTVPNVCFTHVETGCCVVKLKTRSSVHFLLRCIFQFVSLIIHRTKFFQAYYLHQPFLELLRNSAIYA
jgi:hypothetical protein